MHRRSCQEGLYGIYQFVIGFLTWQWQLFVMPAMAYCAYAQVFLEFLFFLLHSLYNLLLLSFSLLFSLVILVLSLCLDNFNTLSSCPSSYPCFSFRLPTLHVIYLNPFLDNPLLLQYFKVMLTKLFAYILMSSAMYI